ncbi:MAG: nickel pincer cofactor biosynthesis protein LarC [Desulfobacterales bacterium]|nr:nickel pincer cofactor biosynthesis protein LarC [Desulfobacterales bacterium]
MKLAYFDCFSGISGDMILGALVDLGVPVDWVSAQLHKLPLTGFSLRAEKTFRSHIAGTRVHVDIDDTGYFRTWSDIRGLIGAADLPEPVRSRSLAVFSRLAEVEARIHGCAADEVHFHEVGGTDGIVDIVGAVCGIDYLHIERIVSSPLPLGKGFVRCRHGEIPVPAPATVRLLEGVPVYGSGIETELVTPTGAALIVSLADEFGDLPNMCIEKSGYGAGSANLADRPNLLRVLIGASPAPEGYATDETVTILEAAIDDMNPELFGFLMERLFAEGALDVYWMPATMKKNRPGTRLEVVCTPERKERLLFTLLSESTSTGVRYRTSARRILQREPVVVDTEYGPVQAKQIRLPDGTFRVAPEFESCRKIALDRGVPVLVIYEAAARGSREDRAGKAGNSRPESV